MKPDPHLLKGIKEIELADYIYDLPDEKIAQFPVEIRDNSKLLIAGKDFISESVFHKIDEHLPADHLLIFNNSRVVRARLNFKKESGAQIEIFCIEPLIPSDYERSFNSNREVIWKCIIGNLKKWKKGILTMSFPYQDKVYEFSAEKLNQLDDTCQIRFRWNCNDLKFSEVIEKTGHIPLPPYINREDKAEDVSRYQTIYARVNGSVAAPTAGLHFTKRVFEKLRKKGIRISEITLHVGAGTFQPVKTDKIAEHEMHSEHFTVTINNLEEILKNTGKIIAVGTTSVRTLESLYWIGRKLLKNECDLLQEISIDQWEPYDATTQLSAEESIKEILKQMKEKGISYLHASTKIMIVPGYVFRLTNGMITNFHQPGSTLLLLIAAWTGGRWKEIYQYALRNNFRFLSYGDSSLLFR